eukprot:scaffold846_cov149-Skeletonema_marinoi.AAC.5
MLKKMMPPLKKLPLLTAEIEVRHLALVTSWRLSAESAVKEKEKTESDYFNMDHSLASASLLLLNVFGPSQHQHKSISEPNSVTVGTGTIATHKQQQH